MQHDSNVQTAEAEISKFPRQLAEDMFDEVFGEKSDIFKSNSKH